MSKNRIRELRNKKQLTLKELADAVGITVSALNNYQQGIREPNIETTMKLADYFGVSIAYLMGFDVSSNYMPVNTEIVKNEDGTTSLFSDSDDAIDALKNNMATSDFDSLTKIAHILDAAGLEKQISREDASDLVLTVKFLLSLFSESQDNYNRDAIKKATQTISDEYLNYASTFINNALLDAHNKPKE